MMLSRAAERVYWTGRYLERAEDTARLVQKYSQLFLDLPPEIGIEWTELVRIVGASEAFTNSGRSPTETEIVAFLLADRDEQDALAHSIRMARENIRNTRDLLPHECWEFVNELYQYGNENLEAAADGRNRFEILAECIGRCQGISGILADTMSHHAPYHFLRLGQSIERADMTSRVVDVAAAYLQHNERIVRRYGSILWTNVLKSVSGFQMYRQYCAPLVEDSQVIDFLLRDTLFPRAIAFSVERARIAALSLPKSDDVMIALDGVAALIEPRPDDQQTAAGVSRLMDAVQSRLGDVHEAVVGTWFLPRDAR